MPSTAPPLSIFPSAPGVLPNPSLPTPPYFPCSIPYFSGNGTNSNAYVSSQGTLVPAAVADALTGPTVGRNRIGLRGSVTAPLRRRDSPPTSCEFLWGVAAVIGDPSGSTGSIFAGLQYSSAFLPNQPRLVAQASSVYAPTTGAFIVVPPSTLSVDFAQTAHLEVHLVNEDATGAWWSAGYFTDHLGGNYVEMLRFFFPSRPTTVGATVSVGGPTYNIVAFHELHTPSGALPVESAVRYFNLARKDRLTSAWQNWSAANEPTTWRYSDYPYCLHSTSLYDDFSVTWISTGGQCPPP